MDMIPRIITKTIQSNREPGFINLIYGPRRVGKTVLLHQLTQGLPRETMLWFNGDTEEAREALGSPSGVTLTKLAANYNTIVIDEAQRIPNIGLSLKILIDAFPNKQFFVTGSSSLVLATGIQETLTGRTLKYHLYPLSTKELSHNLKAYQLPSLLEEQLRFGGYPYLQQLSTPTDKRAYLQSIIDDYLFKDLFLLQNIASHDSFKKLAVLLAFQVGSEVSWNELASILGLDVKTVSRYISLLEQSFVIFTLRTFAKNLRKEVAKSKKYYFWDLGIRNALVDQFLPLDTRTDTGALWENFLAVERRKKQEYSRSITHNYFWRTYEQAEIDWIEVDGGSISAYEFKWAGGKTHTPKAFEQTYHQKVTLISKENYQEFIL